MIQKMNCDKCGSEKNIQFYGGDKRLALCLAHDRLWMKVMDRKRFIGSQWQREYERQFWNFCGKENPKVPIKSKLQRAVEIIEKYVGETSKRGDTTLTGPWGRFAVAISKELK